MPEEVALPPEETTSRKVVPEGYVGQSKKKFERPLPWDEVENAMKTGEVLSGEVVQVGPEKVTVDYRGIRCIIPADHFDARHKSFVGFLGSRVNFVVLKTDRENNLAACSRTQAREEMAKVTYASLKKGQIVSGVVRAITDWGVFMDLGGVTGVIPVQELSYNRVHTPHDVVSVGDYFDVVVTEINRDTEKVRLSLKALLKDPWERIQDMYRTGDFAIGTVSDMAPDGVFIDLAEGVTGMAPYPETFEPQIGDRVRVRIGRILPERRRIRLKIIGGPRR